MVLATEDRKPPASREERYAPLALRSGLSEHTNFAGDGKSADRLLGQTDPPASNVPGCCRTTRTRCSSRVGGPFSRAPSLAPPSAPGAEAALQRPTDAPGSV